MTSYTQDGLKVGTTEYYAVVRWLVPDPNGDVERGDGEYLRDETLSKTFTTRTQAVTWAKRNSKNKDGVEAFIEHVTFDRDEFTDERFGHIIDGQTRVVETEYAQWEDEKIIGWVAE
jgi:hypothetical protein